MAAATLKARATEPVVTWVGMPAKAGHQGGGEETQGHADHAADDRQGDRLQQELQQNVPALGADRQPDTDLPRALGERRRHRHLDRCRQRVLAGFPRGGEASSGQYVVAESRGDWKLLCNRIPLPPTRNRGLDRDSIRLHTLPSLRKEMLCEASEFSVSASWLQPS